MLEFKPITYQSYQELLPYYGGKGISLANSTVAYKVMWHFNTEYAISNGCLILKNSPSWMEPNFDFPLPHPDGCDVNIDAALLDIEEYCVKNYQKLVFSGVDGEQIKVLSSRYVMYESENNRLWRDYIYDGEKMRTFKGKKYAGQRNHINKFLSKYPEAQFNRLTNLDKDKILSFMDKWGEAFLEEKGKNSLREWKIGKKFVEDVNLDEYLVGGIVYKGDIIAFAVAEKVKDTLVIHEEKALHAYEGVNVFLVREFAKCFPCAYINREDDSASMGLRMSKLQYNPLVIADKFVFTVKNESYRLDKIPNFKSERLTYGSIKNSEKQKYYDLCVDEERNEYWGYDYKKDLDEELTVDYFLKVARRDFKNRACINFAIRLNGEFIGETVLFNFDGKGACELGVRILRDYDGRGYGKEAFISTMRWALYYLGMSKIKSSCYVANIPSLKMHEELMKKTGFDGEKNYYERNF